VARQGLIVSRHCLSDLASGCPLGFAVRIRPTVPRIGWKVTQCETLVGFVRVCVLGFTQLDVIDSNRHLSQTARNSNICISIVVTDET
jgi:hypothetical protein